METNKRRRLDDDDDEQMNTKKRMSLENVPELIQCIQSALPSKDAAQTCVVSKSWLHALSTSPAIRFSPSSSLLRKKQHQRNHLRSIYLTLLRYRRHGLPITSLHLKMGIGTNHYRVAQKLIKQAITLSQTSLKDLRLAILAPSFDLPDEIFSNENLNTLILSLITHNEDYLHSLHISSSPAIRCTNLRVLELSYVHITPNVFDQLLSKNKLLESIFLGATQGLNEIKVYNLRYLREFTVSLGTTYGRLDLLEIHDTPSLRLLQFNAPGPVLMMDRPQSSFEIHTIGSLTKLLLDNVYMDDAFSNMIKSNFPFLEELSLEIKWSSVDYFDIISLTLRRLMLNFSVDGEILVQVYAPNLLVYSHASVEVPMLYFKTTPPEEINLSLSLGNHTEEFFFCKVREVLQLPSKFNIKMSSFEFRVSDPFNAYYVKTLLPHPATNVDQLLLKEYGEAPWENSLLIDAVFTICHPMYAKTNDRLRLRVAEYFLELISEGVMENCEIRNPVDGRWVALTSSSLSLLDTTTPDGGFCEFKLSWC